PFTVVGVGDMSGDVFGNGMLLSPAIRLVAAFDHRDIFIDPDPDPATTLAERQRLFDLPRSSWQDYDKALLSRGGGIFPRSLKSIELSAEAAAALGLAPGKATPQEIMSAILRAPVDLLWFGGIGTYVRATEESDDEVGDRANDAIRVAAKTLRAKVVGEGANLGMTQLARIEFGLNGGRCNSDAIDNSAGVNTSDVEVNIKIAFGAAIRAGALTLPARNELLVEMTDEVAGLVLRNNYLQTLAISLTERRGLEEIGFESRMMADLESRGLLDRAVEFLPDDTAIAERIRLGHGLTRAEIGVLLAYGKLTLFDELLRSSVPDDAYLGRELYRYFPVRMHEAFAAFIDDHRLRREIIATMLANSMINRGGPTLVNRLVEETGAGVDAIAFAFAAARDAYGLTDLNARIDALDTRIPGALQLDLYDAVQTHMLASIVWFLGNADRTDGLDAVVGHFRAGIAELAPIIERVLPAYLAESTDGLVARYTEGGVPVSLARRIARLPVYAMIPDMVLIGDRTGEALDRVAACYFAVAAHFQIGRLEEVARGLVIEDYYDRVALDRARRTLADAHRRITAEALCASPAKAEARETRKPKTKGGIANPFDAWLALHRAEADRIARATRDIAEAGELTVSRVAVAAGLISDLAKG
ncbi:MAG TPA: NAD-glutamate dehydrogenase, partial [Kaistiaceae bacterium]|nr:NAD-glutamate dehydrogenase [Kaistiaceae bacterium]